MNPPRRHIVGFTLVEVMMVLIIIGIATSMIFTYNGKRDRRGLQVHAQAEQLAAVLRKVRAMAMDQKTTFGVSFNITNAPGSSGRILNNRSGGHWYRIMGPEQHNGQMDWPGTGNAYSTPYFTSRDHFGNLGQRDVPFYWALGEWGYDWVGPKIVLPKGDVRFLALADADNGNTIDPRWYNGPTYPRPWFGEWDSSTKQMHAWGGYEPELRDFDKPQAGGDPAWYGAHQGKDGPVSYTGFYYEGAEGRISGSVNPTDRYLYLDTNGGNGIDLHCTDGQGNPIPPDTTPDPIKGPGFRLFKKGESRPVINGDWLDSCILFKPDGSALYQDWFQARHEYAKYCRYPSQSTTFNNSDTKNLFLLAPADMSNLFCAWEWWEAPNYHTEVTHYQERTGYWYITLAPDVPDDTYHYETAQQAMDTLMPMCRVGISALGEVKVVEVKRQVPANVSLDATHVDGWWENRDCGDQGYWNNLLWTDNGPAMPAEDFLTTSMLQHRQWWLTVAPPAAAGSGP